MKTVIFYSICLYILSWQPVVYSQIYDNHPSTYDLFQDLEYEDIDYLQESKWHGFWHRKWKGYNFNHINFNDKKVSPVQCDVSKDELDCSTISQSATVVEINKASIVNISVNSFPVLNSVKILRLISLPKLVFIEDAVFERLYKLKELVIVGTAIEQVPQFGKEMESLELVDMYNNTISSVFDEVFKNCPNVAQINLGQNVITYISPSAFTGTKLQLITLHHNELQYVPALEGVGETLIYVGLENNHISSVGKYSLEPLTSLIHLNISNNPIDHFEHRCFGALPNLRFLELLWLSNKIEIPFKFLSGSKKLEHVTLDYSTKLSFSGRAFETVPTLQGISARGCGIEGLDFRSVQGTSALTRLWLDWNELSSFQHSMFINGNFPKLTKLFLNNNQIKDIEWFGDQEFIDRTRIIKKAMQFFNETSFKLIPAVTILSLEQNEITQLRNGTFFGLANLQELYLSKNRLDDDSVEDNAFQGLENLQILMLEDNNLKSVPDAVYHLKDLKTLNMKRNKLTFISANDFSTMIKLTSLNLANNKILLIENQAFPDSLENLRLAYNEFNFIDIEIFHNLAKLQLLSLSSNRISYLPKDVFSQNSALTSIFLDNNYLKFINSSHFRSNPLSEDIIFNGNQIAYIGEGSFSHVKTTGNVLLHNNELFELPSDGMFQDMQVNGQIRVDNNRLTRIKSNTFNNIVCQYFKINDNDITEIESYAFNNIRVLQNKEQKYFNSFDVSNNPIRILREYAFNEISVQNKAMFTNVKPLKTITSLAFNKFSANNIMFTENELEIIESKGFNDVTIKDGLSLNGVGLKWLDRKAIVGSVGKLFLQDNKLKRIPGSALYHVTGNTELHLQGNVIEVIESHSLPNTRDELHLQNNKISLLTKSMFGNNDNSKMVSLKSNGISRLEENVFTGMVKVEILEMGNNSLDEIPDELFSGLKALKTLNLEENKIRHFGLQSDMQNLEEINLENNILSQLDPVLFESGITLKKFLLQSNKLSCGCGLFRTLTPVKQSVQKAVCDNPPRMTNVKLNWAEKDNPQYFTKVLNKDYVCEPIDVATEKIDGSTFRLSWKPPDNINYQGVESTDYCFYDNCPSTQISYDAFCENVDGELVIDQLGVTTPSLAMTHDDKLPYFCYVKLNHHTTNGVVPSSYSIIVNYKVGVPPPDKLMCEDGDRCYQLTAEYFKMSRDVNLFNNYGPAKMVSSPSYKRNLMLNYLYKEDAQNTEDSFVPWYGPTISQNLRTKETLTLPTKVTGGYKVYAELFYPVADNFNQLPRDCDYNVRPLGFTSKFSSSISRTQSEVLKLGAVDEGWVYFGGKLLVEIIAPEANTGDVCAEIRLLQEYARVWIGVMVTGICEINEETDEGKTIKIDDASELEIFVSQRRNCASKLYLEMRNFNLIPESDYLNQEPTFIFETTEEKPIKGSIATMDLTNPFTTDEYRIEILNDCRFFYFVDDTYEFAAVIAPKQEIDPGYDIPLYAPFEAETPPTPLPDKSEFTVRHHNATLALAKGLDFRYVNELKIAYRITGTLPDGSILSSTGVILIKITDYNDNWPIPLKSVYIWDGLKGALSTEPLEISATDEDKTTNADLEFFVGEVVPPENEEEFKKKKELYLFEKVMLNYIITVHVVDKGVPRMGRTTTVEASVSASCVMSLDFEINRLSGNFYVKAPGYYMSTNHKFCDPCEAGYYCYGYGTRSKCTTCDQELMQPDGSTKIIETDDNCNRSKTEFSFGGSTECSPCKAGWICADGNTEPILDQTKYIEPCTFEACPEPEVCPSGAACRNGVKFDCEPGTAGNGEICRFCPPGSYSDEVNSKKCKCCAPGFESSHKKNKCEPCAFNERSDNCIQCVSCRSEQECPCLKNNPCYKGVQCVNAPSGIDQFTCLECPWGTEGDGKVCSDIDECEVEGACFRACNNRDDGYECDPCPEGYSGETPSGIGKEYARNNKQTCTDVDECKVNNGGCGNHVICINKIGTDPECGDCEEGYALVGISAGIKICERSNPCEEVDACAANAYCVYIRALQHACFCNIGYAGNADRGGVCGVDSDADGFPDNNLNCVGHHCKKDNCLTIPNISQEDTDSDYIGDACDSDLDEDGIPNVDDLCPSLNMTTYRDRDGDGVGDICDNCPDDYNPDQLNADRDDYGDECDPNKDNDTMDDDDDSCPLIANDPKDTDRDGIDDKCDNCLRVKNSDQVDEDWNGFGDVRKCDEGDDFDGDGIPDDSDQCPFFSDASQNNRDYGKGEHDSRKAAGDICDNDIDNDGLDNEEDPCPYIYFDDTDSTDDINKCKNLPAGPDTDGDGTPDFLDTSLWNENIGEHVDFFSTQAPWKSFVFDGVRDGSDLGWKYDDKNASYSNEFYQLRKIPSPFVGVTSNRTDDVEIRGTWFVSGDTPGNYIGFVFGFQSARKFLLVAWRRDHRAYKDAGGLRGLHIKAIHTAKGFDFGPDYVEMLWHTGSQGTESTLLWYDRNKFSWQFNQAYRWSLKYRPSVGEFEFWVYQADSVIIHTGPVYYNRVLGGSFGVYAFDQPFTYWSNVKYQARARSNGALYLGNQPARIPLTGHLPAKPSSLLISLWFTLHQSLLPLRTKGLTFNSTLFCTVQEKICIRLIFDSEPYFRDRVYSVSFRYGAVEKTYGAWPYSFKALETREKNRAYSAKWVNLALEYVLPSYALRLYINGEKVCEVEEVAPAVELDTDEMYLGDSDYSSPVKLDELRILKGRIESSELGTFTSDPKLEKYIEQKRLLLWYDMNEGSSSDTLTDRSGTGQHTKLSTPSSLRCPSRSESFMYNMQYNQGTTLSALHKAPQRRNADDFTKPHFTTISEMLGENSNNTADGTKGKKRRRKRYVKYHSEL